MQINLNKQKIVILSLLFTLVMPLSAEKILFSANRMTGQAGNTNTTTTLSGNAYIKTESMEIQADDVELSGENYRYIKSTGNIYGKNLEAHMEFTCDSLEYDRITKVAVLKGNVKLTDTDNDVQAEAQIIEYNQDTEVAVLQIQIRLTQKDNVCSGSYAVYYKKTQILDISGNAQVKQDDDIFRAQQITLDMNTQDIILGGNVKGKVTDVKESKQDTQEDYDSDDSENEEESETDDEKAAEEVLKYGE